jgi:hypothetical protein
METILSEVGPAPEDPSAMNEVYGRLKTSLGQLKKWVLPPLPRQNCSMVCTGQRQNTAPAGQRSSREY